MLHKTTFEEVPVRKSFQLSAEAQAEAVMHSFIFEKICDNAAKVVAVDKGVAVEFCGKIYNFESSVPVEIYD